jgi:hypothetical protein
MKVRVFLFGLYKTFHVKHNVVTHIAEENAMNENQTAGNSQDSTGATATPNQGQAQNQTQGQSTDPNAGGSQAQANGAGSNDKKPLTQEEFDKALKERLAQKEKSDLEKVYARLGIKDDKELDELVKKAQAYDGAKKALDETSGKSQKDSEELAFVKNGIDESRYDDVRLILKGKGKEINSDNIKAELATHKEWLKVAPNDGKPNNVQILGSAKQPEKTPDEKAQIESLLGHPF